jgi:Secretion system C-terminal sorting domain
MRTTAIMASFVVALGAHAQLLTAQGVAITVNNGAQLSVKGDVLAAPGAIISNTGTIDLAGNFNNNSGSDLFGASQGTVLLNGAAQLVGGTFVTLFNNLSATGGQVTLTQDINTGGYPGMTGVLSLGPSQFFLNTHKLYVLNPAPGAITRTTGYLVSETEPLAGYGEVQWFIGASAPGTYVFPFGNDLSNDYLPLIVNTTASGAGGSGSITCSTYPTDPFAAPNNRPLPTGLSMLTDITGTENAPNVVDRFWPMRTDDYSTPPTATITFTYRDSECNTGTNTIIESALQAQRWDGIWSNPPMGSVNTVANTVATPPVSLFAQVWALTQGFTPLPVELLYFDARPEGNDVLCTWSTATEINNDHFTVERSADGDVFTDIGEVDGAGNSQTTVGYTFVDAAPLSGLSYYRMRQTDFDGTQTWSNAVAVWRDAPNVELVVYPNPCSDELFLAGRASEEETFSILDASGRVVMDFVKRVDRSLDVSALASGHYSVQIDNASGRRTARFVKQ